MKLFRMSQFLRCFSTPENRSFVQRRIIHLATKQIVKQNNPERRGPGSTREYDYDRVVELGICLKLMDFSIGTENIRFILDKWREELRETEGAAYLADYIVYIPRSLDNDRPKEDTVLVLAEEEMAMLEKVRSVNDGVCYLVIDIGKISARADYADDDNWERAPKGAAALGLVRK